MHLTTNRNLAVDTEGGFSWAGNRADATIVVDAEQDMFYKNPMFYWCVCVISLALRHQCRSLGHFSKFIRPGDVRVGVAVTG